MLLFFQKRNQRQARSAPHCTTNNTGVIICSFIHWFWLGASFLEFLYFDNFLHSLQLKSDFSLSSKQKRCARVSSGTDCGLALIVSFLHHLQASQKGTPVHLQVPFHLISMISSAHPGDQNRLCDSDIHQAGTAIKQEL